jgi:DNA-binding transcriptional regulator YhcF (GntR family)|tara:strand:- start:2302 stop:2535 length:234 start_codon:yes stop_codon:yes gene_type:complete
MAIDRLKVQGFAFLERDKESKAIVNTNSTEYSFYMNRVRSREQQGDQIRNTIKEINNLKSELREIKNLLKKVVNNGN